ncbi:prepilin-type N-terminal cleavage/methylation domain-containing protein [Microbacterium sp. BE35]|uniref:type II secretion system protein n=1 Tax=Microbacterium sp. BE35 TaxID=2817773 RepID=UPI00285C8EE5|nr:prepilin-type N-terminal cleavage/methylation domain-containing protein [Microbacterium sp. BE35]MDR7190288.1 prepilin-type N-terminal cleavage/methylation domain-containing protein [Microbacterium sp. BE35]
MRATIKNYIEAANRRREEEGEEGFSLIELIIVVVILGILVAIAIPIFGNIQSTAQDNALKAAAASGATAVAAAIADSDANSTAASAITKGSTTEIVLSEASVPATVDAVCVTATGFNKKVSAGPACTAGSQSVTAAP